MTVWMMSPSAILRAPVEANKQSFACYHVIKSGITPSLPGALLTTCGEMNNSGYQDLDRRNPFKPLQHHKCQINQTMHGIQVVCVLEKSSEPSRIKHEGF